MCSKQLDSTLQPLAGLANICFPDKNLNYATCVVLCVFVFPSLGLLSSRAGRYDLKSKSRLIEHFTSISLRLMNYFIVFYLLFSFGPCS